VLQCPDPRRGGRSVTILVVRDVLDLFHDMDAETTVGICSDLSDRDALGFAKYHQNLETFDGRPTRVDLYQEVLDACQYCRKLIEEQRIQNANPERDEEIYKTLLDVLFMVKQELEEEG
jgi:hypothetical protein